MDRERNNRCGRSRGRGGAQGLNPPGVSDDELALRGHATVADPISASARRCSLAPARSRSRRWGVEISLTPGYLGALGAALPARGYAFVEANIRGGGEFGPPWHQAALREKRQAAYDDFAAVAEDLAARWNGVELGWRWNGGGIGIVELG